MIGRVVNVLIPRQLGIVADELAGEGGEPRIQFNYLTDGSKNALGKFTCLCFSPLHARKYGTCRSHSILRLDSHRTGISSCM